MESAGLEGQTEHCISHVTGPHQSMLFIQWEKFALELKRVICVCVNGMHHDPKPDWNYNER